MWNYRLIRHKMLDGTDESWFTVHEVFYGKDSRASSVAVVGYSKGNIILGGKTKEDIISKLDMIKQDIENSPEPLVEKDVERITYAASRDHGEDENLFHWEGVEVKTTRIME